MKKYLLVPVLAALSVSGLAAQDFDTDPVINVQKEDVKFTVGARMMADVAYYHSEFTPVKSGAALTDARIRTSMEYKDWYFYADFDFSRGKFTQKNIFVQYSMPREHGTHLLKAGYYNNPASMANNTSRGSLHFISRAAPVNAMSPGRELGLSYIFYNDHFLANQGIFAENMYNDQAAGFQGITFGGRWLYRPLNDVNNTLHVGLNFRFADICTGEVYNSTLKTEYTIGTSLETYVDPTKDFVTATMPWAKYVYDFGAEVLYRNSDFFVRGEYMYKIVTKERDDQTLFEANLGSIDSWATLESWRKGNPLGTNTFHGGYIEAGYKIFGSDYRYNSAEGLLNGFNGRSLEVVLRYSYVGLNDIVEGERYVPGRDQYYPDGVLADWPATSLSIGGGNMHSATIGLNYSFNKFTQLLVSYTYNKLDRDKYLYDGNFNTVQARLMFQF